MKTKQTNMKAVFTEEKRNGKNHSGEKEQTSAFYVIDKKTEQRVVVCRCWMGRSSSAQTVYAGIWIDSVDCTKYTAGSGSAGGYGYHKTSAAVDYALRSAGIKLYGTPYTNTEGKRILAKETSIAGVGETAIRSALLAVAYAMGCKDCIYLEA